MTILEISEEKNTVVYLLAIHTRSTKNCWEHKQLPLTV